MKIAWHNIGATGRVAFNLLM